MKLQSQIEALETLARIDAELGRAQGLLEAEREALAGKRAQLRSLEEKNAGTSASVGEMDHTRNELIQEARQMSVQLERSREKMSRCRSERELNAVQRELEELRKLYRDREIEIGKLSTLIQQAQDDVTARGAEVDELAGVLGSSAAVASNRMAELEKDLAEIQARRLEAAAPVPRPMLSKYNLILKRRGTAIAHTHDGMCSACYIILPPMLFQQLRRREAMDQCPSCQRLLYFRIPDPTEDVAPAEPAAEADAPPEADKSE